MKFTFDPEEDSGIGLTNLIFFGLSGIAILLFMLNEATQCDDAFRFCSIIIFSIVLLYSFAWIGIFSLILLKKRGHESIDFYYLQEITLSKLGLVPLGLVVVFVVSWWAVEINLPIVGIFISGIIMSSIFIITKSVAPSIMIHGFYNAIVVYLRASQSSFDFVSASQSPIIVPDVGISFFNNDLLTEGIMQVLLIAPAEEMFRVYVMFLFIVIIRAKWDPTSLKAKILAMVIAVSLWSVYHLQIAIK